MSKSMNSSRLVEDICNELSKLICIGILHASTVLLIIGW